MPFTQQVRPDFFLTLFKSAAGLSSMVSRIIARHMTGENLQVHQIQNLILRNDQNSSPVTRPTANCIFMFAERFCDGGCAVGVS